jgi:hypothetical protein
MATDSQQLDAAVSVPGRGLDSLAFACTVIVVDDLDRSSQWYQSVLGFTEHARVRTTGPMSCFWRGRVPSWNSSRAMGRPYRPSPAYAPIPHIICCRKGTSSSPSLSRTSNTRPISCAIRAYRSSGATSSWRQAFVRRRSVMSRTISSTSCSTDWRSRRGADDSRLPAERLLARRSFHICQHTDLAEQDGSRVVALEHADLPALNGEHALPVAGIVPIDTGRSPLRVPFSDS